MFDAAKSACVLIVILWMAALFLRQFRRDGLSLHLAMLGSIYILVGSFSGNVWIFTAIVGLGLLSHTSKFSNLFRIQLFLFLSVLVPISFSWLIPAPGGFNQIFSLNPVRVLALALLLPCLFRPSEGRLPNRLFASSFDKWILLYFGYLAALQLRDGSVTGMIRALIVYSIDYFLIFFIISRNINSLKDFGGLVYALSVSMIAIAGTAFIESLKFWRLFEGMREITFPRELLYNPYTNSRGSMLRGMASFYAPIALSTCLFMVFSFTTAMANWRDRNHVIALIAICLICICGMAATMSKTSFVCFAVFAVLLIVINPKDVLALVMRYGLIIGTLAGIIIASLSMTPFLSAMINSFDGSSDDYRWRLLEAAFAYLAKAPLLGDPNFLSYEELQLKSGQLSIDITNTYLQQVLYYGLPGFMMFMAIQLACLNAQAKIMLRRDGEASVVMGRLLAAHLSFMVGIFLVSYIAYLPLVNFFLIGSTAGLAACYMKASPARKPTSDKHQPAIEARSA